MPVSDNFSELNSLFGIEFSDSHTISSARDPLKKTADIKSPTAKTIAESAKIQSGPSDLTGFDIAGSLKASACEPMQKQREDPAT
jgi:hypothetical protein